MGLPPQRVADAVSSKTIRVYDAAQLHHPALAVIKMAATDKCLYYPAQPKHY
jgi:hypothetical protein